MKYRYSEMYIDVKSPAELVKTQIVRLHPQRLGISGMGVEWDENLSI